jgi:hypothetical protein
MISSPGKDQNLGDRDLSSGSDIVPLDHTTLALVAPNYERMRLAIAECSRVDEVANLVDQAVAAQAYYRQSQDRENEIEASRIRVRAERRMGEILKMMEANGDRANRQSTLKQGPMLPRATSVPTLSDLGIPRHRASRAMQLANVPESEFESVLAEAHIAQPRRMLDERKPSTGALAQNTPATDTSVKTGDAQRWVPRVLAIRDAIGCGELPRPDKCYEKFTPAEIEKLRGALPVIIRYIEQLRVEICPRCDHEGCAHCAPRMRRGA